MKNIIRKIINEVESDRNELLQKLEAAVPVQCYPFLLETLKIKLEIEKTLASCESVLEQAHHELIGLIECK